MSARKPRLEWTAETADDDSGARLVIDRQCIASLGAFTSSDSGACFIVYFRGGKDLYGSGYATLPDAQLAAEDAAGALLKQAAALLEPTP